MFGDDDEARRCARCSPTPASGTDACVIELGRTTPVKRRLMAAGQPVARYDVGPDAPPAGPPERRRRRLSEAVRGERLDAVLVADYGLGALPEEVRARLVALRAEIPLLVVDARDRAGWGASPRRVKPNAAEAAAVLGNAEPTARSRRVGRRRRRGAARRAGCAADVLLTLDVDGVGPAARRPRRARAAHHGTPRGRSPRAGGAGDTFTAGAHRRLLRRSRPTRRWRSPRPPRTSSSRASGHRGLRDRRAHRAAGRRRPRAACSAHGDLLAASTSTAAAGTAIVFTNGCFDVLHRGHVAYLRQARALGDVLIVALNSDDSVAAAQGPGAAGQPAGRPGRRGRRHRRAWTS